MLSSGTCGACTCVVMGGMQSIRIFICGRLRYFVKGFLSVFLVLIIGFQTYAQCTDPVVVKATQMAAEGKIALTVSGGVPFEAKHTPETFYQYRWTDKAGKLLSVQKDVSGLAPGIYKVEVTDDSQCKVVNTYRLEGIPKISLSTENLDLAVPVNESISKTFTITNTGNADLKITKITLSVEDFTIDWEKGNIAAGKSQNVKVTFSPQAVKEYTGEFKVESNAKEGRNILSVLARGISSLESGLNIFPNPVGDVLHIELPAGKTAPVDIQLADTNGRVFYKQAGVKQDRLTLDVSDYKGGIYLLMLYGGGNVDFKAVKKVIINK